MKGAVLVIGSLLWEDETNALDIDQGKLRSDWRKDLDLKNKVAVKVPIRYGRKSSSRKCTYTMIFSKSVPTNGTAFIIPYKKEAKGFEDIKSQALRLSEAEGISTEEHPDRLKASWGAVGIAFNKTKVDLFNDIRKNWHKEFESFNNQDYKIGNESPSIQKNGELNFEFEFPNNIDYVFAAPMQPNVTEYPTINRIIEAILESNPKYDIYVKENFKKGIRIENDDEIIKRLEEKPEDLIKEMTTPENQFYSYLGLLSVKFAQIDSLLSEILVKLTGVDNELISETLTEDNSISKNIDLIRKINKIKCYNEPIMSDLIASIDKIRKVRNMFIHGIWGTPFESDGELKIVCSVRKIKFNEEKDSTGAVIEKTWRHTDHQMFNLQDIKNITQSIEEIQELENIIIESLDTENLNL